MTDPPIRCRSIDQNDKTNDSKKRKNIAQDSRFHKRQRYSTSKPFHSQQPENAVEEMTTMNRENSERRKNAIEPTIGADSNGSCSMDERNQRKQEDEATRHQQHDPLMNEETIHAQERAIWQPQSPSRNIVHQLYQRSVYGHHRACPVVSCPTNVPWNAIPDLYLSSSDDHHAAVDNTSSMNQSSSSWSRRYNRVTAIAFDPDGTFLAVASANGCIRLWDWDLVRYHAERQEQGRQQNNDDGDHHNADNALAVLLSPILSFSVVAAVGVAATSSWRPPTRTTTISWLEWNPYNSHELAVGCSSSCASSSSVVLLYDLTQLVDESSLSQHHHHHHAAVRRLPMQGHHLHSNRPPFLFWQQGHQALSVCNRHVYCWNLHRDVRHGEQHRYQQQVPTLHWKFTWSTTDQSVITSMSLLGTDCILLGSATGQFALVNSRHMQRASFARSATPTVVQQWDSRQRWQGYSIIHNDTNSNKNTDPAKNACTTETSTRQQQQQSLPLPWPTPAAMGIQQVFVLDQVPVPLPPKSRLQHQHHDFGRSLTGRCRVVWITSGGWALQGLWDLIPDRSSSSGGGGCRIHIRSTTVLHHPPIVRWMDAATGQPLLATRITYSMPTCPIVTAGSTISGACCWQRIAPTTNVLPSRDARVLVSTIVPPAPTTRTAVNDDSQDQSHHHRLSRRRRRGHEQQQPQEQRSMTTGRFSGSSPSSCLRKVRTDTNPGFYVLQWNNHMTCSSARTGANARTHQALFPSSMTVASSSSSSSSSFLPPRLQRLDIPLQWGTEETISCLTIHPMQSEWIVMGTHSEQGIGIWHQKKHALKQVTAKLYPKFLATTEMGVGARPDPVSSHDTDSQNQVTDSLMEES